MAQDIRKLVRLAYPLAPVEVREQLAKDCYVDAMNDSDLEWYILQERPKNVEDTVKLALEYEAFQRGKRGRQADFRPFRAGEETLSGGGGTQYYNGYQQHNSWPHRGTESPQQMTDKARNIKQCEYCNKRGHEEKECWTKDRQNKPNHNKGKNGNRDCFYCGSPRHFMADCEQTKTDMKNVATNGKHQERPEVNQDAFKNNSGNGC